MTNATAAGSAPRKFVDFASIKYRLTRLVATPVLTLLYHRVDESSTDPHGICVAPERFREQLEHIRQRCRLVRFEDDWSRIWEPAVCITFDDGYADNARNALPLLEAAEVPATFFVSTGTIGTDREFWWDELERLTMEEGGGQEVFELADDEHAARWPTTTRSGREHLSWDLHERAMKVGSARREGWLRQLRNWAAAGANGRPGHRALDERELRVLSSSPWVTLGAHTVSHSPLAALSDGEQRAEVVESKETLERLTGRAVEVFSYPFGKRTDYNRSSIKICREVGFKKAAAAFAGLTYRWTDTFQVPRVVVRDWDRAAFAERLRSFGF